ncbi:hypothetical protein Taro_031427 [Colocasia esculenta]|uniref:RNase H type-1 domain-containing protein n=1 Tax=Colocasia esculenta TaxID=4460 RepID=A0A843VRX3_COLES|nr:hypothetical protein [Colocasia esculenta]
MAALSIPVTVMRAFHRILANFFWGSSDIANKVWADLLHLLHFNNRAATSVNDGLLSFLSCQVHYSVERKLAHYTFMSAMWEIWCSRNQTRFQEEEMSGRLELNVDGVFKLANSGAGGGGILRDHEGRCVFAFAKNYQGAISALDVETRALRDGLTICCNKGILDILVEIDSLNLKRIVTGQMHRLWELTCIIQDVAIITKKVKVQIKHVPREANQVAHSLAGYGCSTKHFRCWDSGADIPHVVKGPYRLDKVGCPTLML